MASLIEDYALIGNCRGAGLVSKSGSLDWLCLPRFDSAATFAALLGNEQHGCWKMAPTAAIKSVKRRYRPGTLILESVIDTESGSVRLIDFMAPQTQSAEVFRIVQGISGQVPMHSELIVRFDYGSIEPWSMAIERGVRMTGGPDSVFCRTDARWQLRDHSAVAEFSIAAGEQVAFELTWAPTHLPDPLELDAEHTLEETNRWWLDWYGMNQYRGPWRKDVLASLVVLKALTYRPTGGIVAAPTTSLPEHLGGGRNWDYRYCWLRDATFTLYAFLVGGYIEEARAWRQWLINAVAGAPSELQIMYGIAGERRLTEMELPWLPGYANSRPVRIGNAAYSQRQLDVPGEIMEALHLARRQGLSPSPEAWRLQCAVMEFVESAWRDTDEGIWEIRGKRQHFTHSKVMAWVAADRAVKDVEHFGLEGEVEKWRRLREEIHRQVCAEGYNHELGAFVQHYGSKEPDASLLMLPLVGFVDAKDPRMRGTVRLIEERLVHNGFVERYCTETNVDGLPPGEGAFLLCSFWLADNYTLADRHDEAIELFKMLLSLRNDVGLLAEEYLPQEGRMLGNFPQAFSHIGLINTARNLEHGGPAEDRATEALEGHAFES